MADQKMYASEASIRHDVNQLAGSDHWGHLAGPLDDLLDAKDAEIGRLRAALRRIADGATGYLDRDGEMAGWAREALLPEERA